ncbi:MAG: hypothetical protein Q9O62_11485 [Ardenticatenia bacterium]|nr:hypothetical protein [Ardenticatenia bacterium]
MAVQTPTMDTWGAQVRRGRSPLADAVRQLLNNRLAVVSGVFILFLLIVALFADTALLTLFTGGETKPLLAPYHYSEANFKYHDLGIMERADDGRLFILGTDALGRDLLSRTIYGARVSLSVAIMASWSVSSWAWHMVLFRDIRDPR